MFRRMFSIALLLICSAVGSQGQGTFGNLDFESANVPDLPPGQGEVGVSAANAFPSWVAYYDNGLASLIGHNTLSLAGAALCIEGPQYSSSYILQGQYTAYLVGDHAPPGGTAGPNSTALAQVGQIPATALSLRFLISPGSLFQVTFGSTTLPVTDLGGTSKFRLVGADISQFAGQTGELRFTASPNAGGYLDLITFSQVPIPEPSCLTMVALGVGVLLLRTVKGQVV